MTSIVFKTAVLLIASAAAVRAETRPSTEDASRAERKTDSPTERSITFHVLGLMKTKSGAT